MTNENLTITHIYGISPEPLKFKLTKGQKDSYGWEITVAGNDISSMLAQIRIVDQKLKVEYGGA